MAERSHGFEDPSSTSFVSAPKCSERLVWAYCEAADCGGVAPIRLAQWGPKRRAPDNLTALETRLRCICGARQARLSLVPPDATSRRVTIYPFS